MIVAQHQVVSNSLKMQDCIVIGTSLPPHTQERVLTHHMGYDSGGLLGTAGLF